ncbi:MAG: hypothetical protein WDN49_26115 [Acetobacteraceae bacterium]
MRRLEDARFLTGTGRYTDDIDRPGQVFAQIVRSTHAHARLGRIETEAARAVPGVLGVFGAADLAADGVGPIPCGTKVATVEPMRVPARYALASDRVRHVGEPVAFVVAETRRAAQDAAELVEIAYEALPCVVDARDALAPGCGAALGRRAGQPVLPVRERRPRQGAGRLRHGRACRRTRAGEQPHHRRPAGAPRRHRRL